MRQLPGTEQGSVCIKLSDLILVHEHLGGVVNKTENTTDVWQLGYLSFSFQDDR